MSRLRLSINDINNIESKFSSAARKQLKQKLSEMNAENKTKNNKKTANKIPAAESPAQVNLRHLLKGDDSLKAYKDDWIENYVGASPTSRYEIDFALPALKIGIEVDGWQYHGKFKEAFLRDREKDFEIKTNGWVLLRLQANLLLNYRALDEPSRRINAFLDCWIPRQTVLIKYFDTLPTESFNEN